MAGDVQGVEVEESVQSAQSPRGIGRASAHTCAYRDILVEVYSYRRKSEIFLQQPVRPDAKFFFNISPGQIIGCPEMNHRDGVRLDDFQDIHMCNYRVEKCLNVVIAVASAGCHPQSDIDLRLRIEDDVHGINRIFPSFVPLGMYCFRARSTPFFQVLMFSSSRLRPLTRLRMSTMGIPLRMTPEMSLA